MIAQLKIEGSRVNFGTNLMNAQGFKILILSIRNLKLL